MRTLARSVRTFIVFTVILTNTPSAENPKKLAFLRAIEDRDEEDFDLLDEVEEQPESVPDSQDTSDKDAEPTNESVTTATPVNSLKRKAPQEQEQSGGKENVPPMAHRRRLDGGTSKRPATLAEIREAVSFLIDEPLVPDSQVSGSEVGSDHEDDYGDDNVERTANVRHEVSVTTVLGNARASVVNRLSIVHTHEENTGSGPLAFHSAVSNSLSGFKVPGLLRRATTNLSTTSTTSSDSATSTTGPENSVRRGGSKKSNIHYQAREAERKKIVEASERRRKEEVKRSVIGKGRQSVLGVFGSKGRGFE
jgi:mediator of replication checkpoint protein 1